MALQHLAPLILGGLVALGLAFAALPTPSRDPDEVERGSTTILPEDR